MPAALMKAQDAADVASAGRLLREAWVLARDVLDHEIKADQDASVKCGATCVGTH